MSNRHYKAANKTTKRHSFNALKSKTHYNQSYKKITNKNKVKVQSPKEPIAISPDSNVGPKFGYPTIEIRSNCLSNKSSYIYYNSRYKIITNQFIGIDSTDDIYFQVDDYEVYQVIFLSV